MILVSEDNRVLFKDLSIIVPIFNEKENIQNLISHLNIWRQKGCEVIIVDGGSQDGSIHYLIKQGFTILISEKGRAKQMNMGVKYSSCTKLLFLHADTRLPINADDIVITVLSNKIAIWGRFNVSIYGKSKIFPIISAMINWRSKITKIATGEQAIFVCKEQFEKIGCFIEQPLMEDIELSKTLNKISTPICLTQKVITSGRRWEKYGIFSTILLMWKLRLLYWCGVSSQRLSKEYL